MEKDKLFSVRSLILIFVGLAVNIIGAKLALALELPLFLDSIGTICAAALGGYLPGIVVGFASNIINSVSDPITMYYGIISVAFAVMAAFLSKRGVFNRLGKTMLSALGFSLVGGGFGSVLTWMLYGMNFGTGISAPFAIYIHDNFSIGEFGSQFIADMGIDVFDKLLTFAIVFSIMHLLPRRVLDRLPLGYVYFDATGEKSVLTMSKAQNKLRLKRGERIFSLKHKVAMITIITSFVLGVVSVTISFQLYKDTMDKNFVKLGNTATEMMSKSLNGDNLEQYILSGVEGDGYGETENLLIAIRDSVPDILYMYVYQIREDGCHVIFDLDTEDLEGCVLGEVVAFDKSFEKYLPQLLNGEKIPPVVANGQYGWLLSVYQPIFNSDGECVAYACADIDMDDVISDRYIFVIRTAALLFGVSVIINAAALWFSQKRIVVPLDALSSATGKFAYDSEENLQKNTEAMRNLKINTGDEIETLYHAVEKTTSDVSDYIEQLADKNHDIAQKADKISRLQENIIIGFAGMVEYRDMSTGLHIKRTAVYVRAVAEELSREGKYPDLLTPEYITNLEKAAPLHDIGKIVVSDVILNKRGRLTDEEFELIKSHSSAGVKILNEVFVGIEDDSFLSTAVGMVESHHERWDGTGYPNGLKGEGIPLSARIMAIADVFDALISERCYKSAYSFDKAIEIIKSESGTHFDPTVVEAFIKIAADAEKSVLE